MNGCVRSDMDFEQGGRYSFDAVSYPRYWYLKQRLCDLLSRWQRIMDAGGLPDCVSHGRDKIKKISQSVEQLGSEISVYVFGENSLMRMIETDLHVHTKTSYQKRTSVTLESHLRLLKAQTNDDGLVPVITVILVTSLSYDTTMRYLSSKLSGLSKQQFESFIISVTDSNTSYIYSDLLKQNTDLETAKSSGKEIQEGSAHLAKQIQYFLEKNNVTILEQIVDFLKAFSLSARGDPPNMSLADTISAQLDKSPKDPFVVKDILPYPKEGVVLTDRMPEDTELRSLSSAIGSGWESLGPLLGLSSSEISKAKSSSSDMHEQIYNTLLMWKNKDPTDTLIYLLQVLEHISSVISVSTNVIKEVKQKTDERPSETTKIDKDIKFQKTLLEFVVKKSKCALIDALSRQYGISASLINEFLNEGYFGYEKKVIKLAHNVGIPNWPEDPKDGGVSICRSFVFKLVGKMDPLLSELEDYIKEKHQLLVILKRLEFELFGLLMQTTVPLTINIPDIPRLPPDMQTALLKLPDIHGCGTIWGELVIHSSELVPISTETEVKSILSKYSYKYPYSFQLAGPWREQVDGFRSVEHGTSIRAKQHLYGTLGCFVKIKTNDTAAESVSVENPEELYAVTCAHCVKDCLPEVKTLCNGAYETLGTKVHYIYEPEALDVATIKLDTSRTYSKGLKDSKGELPLFSKWQFYDQTLVKLDVYKHGSATELTKGICVSKDYKKKISELNVLLQSKPERFDPMYNILIASKADFPSTENPRFSEEGDSGAVVCTDDINTGGVLAVALLHGQVTVKRKDSEEESHTYSSSMLETVRKLEERYNCTIKPGTD